MTINFTMVEPSAKASMQIREAQYGEIFEEIEIFLSNHNFLYLYGSVYVYDTETDFIKLSKSVNQLF